MPPLQLLLVRLTPLHDQRSQVFAGQTPAGVAQVEEEDIVDLIDHVRDGELAPDLLQMLAHCCERHDEQELRRLSQPHELAHPPQRPASQARPKPAALSGSAWSGW